MKNSDQRTTILIFLGITLVAMLLLAVGMPKQLNQGQAIPFSDFAPAMPPTSINAPAGWMEQVIRILSIILWLTLPLYIIYLIISPKARKQFLKDILRLMPFMLLMLAMVYMLQQSQNQNQKPPPEPGTHDGQQTTTDQSGSSAENPFLKQPAEWVVTAATIAVGVVSTLLIVGIFYYLARIRRVQLEKNEPLKKMAKEAQSAIDLINMGGDLRDVIIRCYLEMNRIVLEARNLKRGDAMTPHEFEIYLKDKGLPSDPVHNLTSLFEKVRYGGEKPGRSDETVALSSLTAIVTSCRRAMS